MTDLPSSQPSTAVLVTGKGESSEPAVGQAKSINMEDKYEKRQQLQEIFGKTMKIR